MKDATKKELETSRPTRSVSETVEFCLDMLFKDKSHSLSDEVCKSLTYEELIGALLLSRDVCKRNADL